MQIQYTACINTEMTSANQLLVLVHLNTCNAVINFWKTLFVILII
jgi:hypothetical protein